MKPLPTIRPRRRRTGTAAAAYSHAFNMLGDTLVAQHIATTALRRGAHSRTAVLAHARHLTAQHAATTVDASSSDVIPDDMRALAGRLASSRPLTERAIVDLELRYGLDQGSFARVLGVPSGRAVERSATVATTWSEVLDPALMAALGSGACEGLATVLSVRQLESTGTDATSTNVVVAQDCPARTVDDALHSAPRVLEHSRNCETCAQRLKMLTPVRTVVGQLPAEVVPPAVAAAARSARRRLPTALPPSIEARRIDVRRLRTPVIALGVVASVAFAAYAAVDAFTGRAESQDERVARLVESPPQSSLLGTPTLLTPETSSAALANNGDEPILWNATASAPWLSVQPDSGRLQPRQSVSLRVGYAVPAGEREENTTVTIEGSDGSKQTLRYSSTG